MGKIEDEQPSEEEVLSFRQMVLDKYEFNLIADPENEFDPIDLHRFKTDDRWVEDFIINNDGNIKHACKQCIETLEWRKKFGVNEITEDNVRMEYLINSSCYLHGRDLDGKLIFMFKSKWHTRGSKNMDDLKRCLLYWIERAFRESKNEKITVIFDMMDTGMSNIDLEFTKLIINIFKQFYPNSLNWILIYDMPWIMNATFQIIKKLLPKRAVEVLKFVNVKNIRQYIDDDNIPTSWGGRDNYAYSFKPESRPSDEGVFLNGASHQANNNNIEQANFNFMQRKVHFANNLSESPSPMSELSTSSFETRQDMLQLSPAETIVFQKNSNNELTGNVHILNVSKKAVTYKVKTTAPDKYRVRPSSGTLSPITSANINVVIQKGQQIQPVNKDKFLVMCMALPDGEPLTADEIANMWKEVTANSPEVEQHRLKCTMPANVTTAIINNTDTSTDVYTESHVIGLAASSMSHNGTKQTGAVSQQHLHATINQLSETVSHLNQQVKAQQSLQWITIFVFVMISIAIVYILKMEIQNSNSQYCIDK